MDWYNFHFNILPSRDHRPTELQHALLRVQPPRVHPVQQGDVRVRWRAPVTKPHQWIPLSPVWVHTGHLPSVESHSQHLARVLTLQEIWSAEVDPHIASGCRHCSSLCWPSLRDSEAACVINNEALCCWTGLLTTQEIWSAVVSGCK